MWLKCGRSTFWTMHFLLQNHCTQQALGLLVKPNWSPDLRSSPQTTSSLTMLTKKGMPLNYSYYSCGPGFQFSAGVARMAFFSAVILGTTKPYADVQWACVGETWEHIYFPGSLKNPHVFIWKNICASQPEACKLCMCSCIFKRHLKEFDFFKKKPYATYLIPQLEKFIVT